MAVIPSIDQLRAAIVKFCADNPWKPGQHPAPNGNSAIQGMLLKKFQILYTTGQISGIVTRAGINRGGIIPKNPAVDEKSWSMPGFPAMLTAHSASREQTRLKAIEAAARIPKSPTMKVCPTCFESKSTNLFGHDARGAVRSDCIACREAVLASPTKKCNRCNTNKPRSAFGYHPDSPDRLHPTCRECRAENYHQTKYDLPNGRVIASDKANQTKKQKLFTIGAVPSPRPTLPVPAGGAGQAARPAPPASSPQSIRHLQAVASAAREPGHISPFNNSVYRPVIREEDDPFGIFNRLPELDTRPHICQFPYGDPGSLGFRFCGDHQHPGRPYCRPHCEIAYNHFDPYRHQEPTR